jgi:hypothetical protein
MTKQIFLSILAALTLGMLTACGGGGGGGPAGNALVRGRVLLVGTNAGLENARVAIGGRADVTDVEGRFEIPQAPSGNRQMTVTGTGVQTLTQNLNVPASGILDLGDVYVLDSASGTGYTAQVTGTVVRADTLALVPGATVIFNGQVTTTNASGVFTVTGLPVGLGPTGGQQSIIVGQVRATGLEDTPIRLTLSLGASPPVNDLGPIAIAPPTGGIQVNTSIMKCSI